MQPETRALDRAAHLIQTLTKSFCVTIPFVTLNNRLGLLLRYFIAFKPKLNKRWQCKHVFYLNNDFRQRNLVTIGEICPHIRLGLGYQSQIFFYKLYVISLLSSQECKTSFLARVHLPLRSWLSYTPVFASCCNLTSTSMTNFFNY